MAADFWDRLAARVRPTETLKTLEDPRAIARAYSVGLWVSTGQILLSAGVWAFFGEVKVAWIAVGLALAFVAAFITFAVTGSVYAAVVIAFVGGTAGNIYAHVALGGYAYSGAIMLFGVTYVALIALLVGRRLALISGLVYTIAGVVLGFMEESLKASRDAPDPTMRAVFFVVVLVGSINIIAPLVVFFMSRLSYERERAEKLLLNVLPAEVASELKVRGQTTARRYESVSVLFADIVGFTPLAASMEPEDMVNQLNDVFTYFDALAEKHGVEKMRTIGDAYMVAAGVPIPSEDHARALAAMSLEMLAYPKPSALSFRIGINSGPVIAGVIGTRKFQYDIWGDTVNIASRMESHGEPGRIQISDATYQLIRDSFAVTPRGQVEIKGKGSLTTWWLEADLASAQGGATG